MGKCTYIDGIASSQALDTAGEIVDLKGIDISSLIGAAFNFEHKSDFPAQIVGKILEAHKIFSKEDCQNDRHEFFWNKYKIPFLYVMGRLFDDKKDSSKEVAALFKDDEEHPNEHDMVGFSVEGNKIEKVGVIITRSIARKVTITHIPANKTCIAEILPDKKQPKEDIFADLFRGEMELFKFEPSYLEILEKKENLQKDVGTGGGAFIGSSLAMNEEMEKSGWSHKILGDTLASTHPTHGNLETRKNPLGKEGKKFNIYHNNKLVGTSASAKDAGQFHHNYATKLGTSPMKKALDAGSALAAPNQLSQGAALIGEDLDKKPKKVMQKGEKSKWLQRADEAYGTWAERENFKKYMKEKIPHLADGEVDAIGRVLALKKDVQKEKNLSKMYASHYTKKENSDG